MFSCKSYHGHGSLHGNKNPNEGREEMQREKNEIKVEAQPCDLDN